MTFLNLEDETGMLNVTCSPGLWQRYRKVARTSAALVVRGVLERADGVITYAPTGWTRSRCRPRWVHGTSVDETVDSPSAPPGVRVQVVVVGSGEWWYTVASRPAVAHRPAVGAAADDLAAGCARPRRMVLADAERQVLRHGKHRLPLSR